MASDGSDTNGALYASLGKVILIVLLAAVIAAVLATAMGALHRLANPSARSERESIPLKKLKMLAAWPLDYVVMALDELAAQGIRFSRYKPRHYAKRA